jgi:four helix bundle protein
MGETQPMFRFQKFDVWHKAAAFASHIYSATADFPVDERFGLTSQMRRAAVSVSSNVAEGSARASDQEFARFVEIAYGSLMEVVSQSIIAKDQKFLAEDGLQQVLSSAEELSRMLSGLRSRLTK